MIKPTQTSKLFKSILFYPGFIFRFQTCIYYETPAMDARWSNLSTYDPSDRSCLLLCSFTNWCPDNKLNIYDKFGVVDEGTKDFLFLSLKRTSCFYLENAPRRACKITVEFWEPIHQGHPVVFYCCGWKIVVLRWYVRTSVG